MIGWVIAAGVGYLLIKQNPSLVAGLSGSMNTLSGGLNSTLANSGVAYQTIGPNSDPSKWYKGIRPDTVTIGGSAAPTGWSPTADNLAASGAKAGAEAGAVTGLVAAVGATGIFGTSAISVAIGGAIPFVGIALVGVTMILGVLAKHHQQALANEGKVLNTTDPSMINAFVLVLQAVLAGEMNTMEEVQQACEQVAADWYGQVKSIQRGTWHFTGQDLSADYNKVWIKRTQPSKGAPGYTDYHAPDPCNAACVIGHFFAERNKFLVEAACSDALAGHHGMLVLPAIPPHDTQSGFPEVDVVY